MDENLMSVTPTKLKNLPSIILRNILKSHENNRNIIFNYSSDLIVFLSLKIFKVKMLILLILNPSINYVRCNIVC